MTATVQRQPGEVLWEPSPERVQQSELARYMRWLSAERGLDFADYRALWTWSVERLEDFWASAWDFFDVKASAPYETVLRERRMPGADWFPGAELNYAEHALRYATSARPAIVFVSEGLAPVEVSWEELRRQVGSLTARLRDLGVGRGDRVVGYLPNIPQAVVAFLACASVGAIWSSCSPDFGTRSVVDRFAQLDPVVLIAADGYRFNGKEHERAEVVKELQRSLPTVRHTLWVSHLRPEQGPPEGIPAARFDNLVAGNDAPQFDPVPFSAPLWVLYSSGTTGIPKGIVHSHGGTLLEQMKSHALGQDVKASTRFFWYTSTSWTMWNIVVSSLLLGSTITLYDGSPMYPDAGGLWRLAEQCKLDVVGVSAAYILGSQKAGLQPGKEYDLSQVSIVGSTGSPLPASGFRWVYEAVKDDVWLISGSGGTDVATGFVGGCALAPVRAGEIQGPLLGVKAEAWNADGQHVIDEVGELVVTEPMPSMPLYFWNDTDGSRYHDAYFAMFPGVWRHGDWMIEHSWGTVMISGRSDSTLNRMGVRMGSAEIYEAVEGLPQIREALVIGAELPDGGYAMPLYVVLEDGVVLDDELKKTIADAIRSHASPRHVPDDIVAAPAVPHTLTGKKLEVPIKRILLGTPVEDAVNLGAVDSPDVVQWFASRPLVRD